MRFLLYSTLDAIPLLLTSMDTVSQMTTVNAIILILIRLQTTLDAAIVLMTLDAVPEATLDVDHDTWDDSHSHDMYLHTYVIISTVMQ